MANKRSSSNSLFYSSQRDTRRRLSEHVFKAFGFGSILIASIILWAIIFSIVAMGKGAFSRYEIALDIVLEETRIDPSGHREAAVLRTADYRGLLRDALLTQFPNTQSTEEINALQALLSPGGEFQLVRMIVEQPDLIGQTITLNAPLSDDAEQYFKRGGLKPNRTVVSKLTEKQINWLNELQNAGLIHSTFNYAFLTGGDSSEPELAGVAAGVVGSFFALFIALGFAAPLGIATAVYLEEFAPKNRISDIIEININNLAAVPSIVFGLLGLAIFINVFGMPRSAPLVGGLVLGLMTLPTVIIATRASIRSIPRTIYEGALAVGASRLQANTDHVLPAAAPGILTGVIIGLAQALGETAPLLMIGMVAFVVTPPVSVFDPSSALPVLIYLWAESPERAFVEKTAGAAMVLLLFLGVMNFTAVWLRRRFQIKGI